MSSSQPQQNVSRNGRPRSLPPLTGSFGSAYLTLCDEVQGLRGMVTTHKDRLEGLQKEMDELRRSVQGSVADPPPGLSSAVRSAPMTVPVSVVPGVPAPLRPHPRMCHLQTQQQRSGCWQSQPSTLQAAPQDPAVVDVIVPYQCCRFCKRQWSESARKMNPKDVGVWKWYIVQKNGPTLRRASRIH